VSELILSERRGPVCRVTLNRPDKLNAMTPAMERELFERLEAALGDDAVRTVVLCGAGRAFSSGADLGAAGGGAAPVHDAPRDMLANRERVERWMRLWSAPKPLIAQVHGYCLGTANELVACCDLVVCGESARLGMPEVRRFALPPTLALWPVRIGLQRTKELLFTGRLVSGAEAVALGMACAVVPDAELAEHVERLAADIAQTDPRLLAVSKQAANAWYETLGVRAAALRGADYHAIYHQASEWGRVGHGDRKSEGDVR
jgi:enoyl-CoA hydratase